MCLFFLFSTHDIFHRCFHTQSLSLFGFIELQNTIHGFNRISAVLLLEPCKHYISCTKVSCEIINIQYLLVLFSAKTKDGVECAFEELVEKVRLFDSIVFSVDTIWVIVAIAIV